MVAQHRSFIKHILGLLIVGALAVAAWHFLWPKEGIYLYDPKIDRQYIVDFFNDKENRYWMLSDYHPKDWTVTTVLDTRSPGNHEPESAGKMIIKTYRISGKPAGFAMFYPKQLFEGAILFVGVGSEFRKKGIARKLTNHAISELKKGGAEVVRLWTRSDNVRSRALYESMGFRQFWTDGAYVRYEKFLKEPATATRPVAV